MGSFNRLNFFAETNSPLSKQVFRFHSPRLSAEATAAHLLLMIKGNKVIHIEFKNYLDEIICSPFY
jgi:hypothetical protein